MKTATRTIEIDYRKAATDSRTVPVVVSSERPVDRGDYLEVLSHQREAIDLTREPLPLIESHEGNRVNIGLVEGLRLDGGRLRGTARLGSSSRANELWPDIQAGIVRNVSIGYRVTDWSESHSTEPPTLTATRWQPFECSIVSIPADETVGFYRNFPKDNDMSENHAQETERLSRSERRAMNREAVDEETRVRLITDVAERFEVESLGLQAVRDGWEVQKFNDEVMKIVGERSENAKVYSSGGPSSGHGVDPAFRRLGHEFSHRQADSLHAYIAGAAGLAGDVDMGPFRERSQEITRQLGVKPRHGGILFPLGELHSRALTAGGDGNVLIAEELLAGSFIDVLRAKSVVMELGAMVLPGLVGDVSIPRKTAGLTGYWLNLDGSSSITESNLSLDSVSLSMKSVAGFTKYSHKMLVQSSLAVESMIRQDLAATLATALDVGAIQGSGTSNQPTGVTATSNINTDTYSSAPTFEDIVGMEGLILADNVDMAANVAYLTTPALCTGLKTTEKATDTGMFVWEGTAAGEGRMNGYKAMATSNCPADTVILGKWSDLMIGMWNAVEILVDPYTGIQAGNVAVRAILDVDVAVRTPQSFCVMTAA